MDGVTRQRTLTVDSLPTEVHHAKLSAIRALAEAYASGVSSSARRYHFVPDTSVLSLHLGSMTVPLRGAHRASAGRRGAVRAEPEALDRLFRLLLLACGVSYYKALRPTHPLRGLPVDAATAAFFTDFYVKGLGEFAWRNGVDLAQAAHRHGDR